MFLPTMIKSIVIIHITIFYPNMGLLEMKKLGMFFKLLLLSTLLILVGCAKQAKVNDASNHLLIQRELIKISSYGEDLKSNKDALTAVPDAYDRFMIKPQSRINDLTIFLEKNDCLEFSGEERDLCYRRTRLMLIQATKALDEAESATYYLNRSVGVLRNNISTIILNFPEVKY